MYPNPVEGNQQLYFNELISGSVFTVDGQLVKEFANIKTLNIDNLMTGIYILRTKNNGAKRFIKF